MSSTTEHQKETPPRSDSVAPRKNVDSTSSNKPHDGMPSLAKQTGSTKNELAAQLATLKLADENVASDNVEEKVVDKASDDEFFGNEEAERLAKVDENADPKLTAEVVAKPENVSDASTKKVEEATTSKSEAEQVSRPIKVDNINPKLPLEIAPNPEDTYSAPVNKTEEAAASKSDGEQVSHQIKVNELTYEAAPKPKITGSASTKTTEYATSDTTTPAVPTDETATPRLVAYIKLHDDMMTAKSSLSTDPAKQTHLYHHASHVARTLLVSNVKHSDLPLVMHAHACMVIGCSDVDDAFEKMEEALTLVRQAVREGLLTEK